MKLSIMKKHCRITSCRGCTLNVDRGCLLTRELAKNPSQWNLKRLSNLYKHALNKVKPDKSKWDWIKK